MITRLKDLLCGLIGFLVIICGPVLLSQCVGPTPAECAQEIVDC